MLEELKNKKLLIIVESPNKCAHIQEYLKKAGYTVKVLASCGHIMELANGGSYYNTGIDPIKDFAMDIRIAEDKREVVNKLKAQVAWADYVYLMTDPDREGFVISWSLIKFLKLNKIKYRRAITHEITPVAVVSAIENPIPMDENLVEAGLARLALDKMIGYRLSPIAKNYVGAKSVGRCQSVGLKLVADREREIQNFKPETYFDLYVTFEKNKNKFKAKFAGNDLLGNVDHLRSRLEVDTVKSHCTENFIIEDIKRREKEEPSKPPFCTATFQQEAASKCNLKVKDAMSIAQALFEQGTITYMRTDDTEFAPEFVPQLKNYIEKIFGRSSFTPPRVAKKSGTDQAGHECLRVTDLTLTPELFNKTYPNQLHQRIYKLIWQRTVAAALPNAVISETQYLINNNGEKFILVSNELIKPGYREVYGYQEDDQQDTTGPIKETFSKEEILQNTTLEDLKKETRPPARFSEATLIKKLQTEGIGRPSTYATIVETVLSTTRGYAELDGKSIVPTNRGMQLAAFLDRAFSNIINLNYTKHMEEDLDKVAANKLSKLEFLTNFYDTLENTIKDSPELADLTKGQTAPVCPKCGANMVLRRSKWGKSFWGCQNYPKCNGLINIK